MFRKSKKNNNVQQAFLLTAPKTIGAARRVSPIVGRASPGDGEDRKLIYSPRPAPEEQLYSPRSPLIAIPKAEVARPTRFESQDDQFASSLTRRMERYLQEPRQWRRDFGSPFEAANSGKGSKSAPGEECIRSGSQSRRSDTLCDGVDSEALSRSTDSTAMSLNNGDGGHITQRRRGSRPRPVPATNGVAVAGTGSAPLRSGSLRGGVSCEAGGGRDGGHSDILRGGHSGPGGDRDGSLRSELGLNSSGGLSNGSFDGSYLGNGGAPVPEVTQSRSDGGTPRLSTGLAKVNPMYSQAAIMMVAGPTAYAAAYAARVSPSEGGDVRRRKSLASPQGGGDLLTNTLSSSKVASSSAPTSVHGESCLGSLTQIDHQKRLERAERFLMW